MVLHRCYTLLTLQYLPYIYVLHLGADISSKLDSLTEKVNTINDHVQYTRNEIDDIESELEDFEDEVDDLEEEMGDVKEELGNLQDQMARKSAAISALLHSLKSDYTNKTDSLRNDVAALQQDVRSTLLLVEELMARQSEGRLCNMTTGKELELRTQSTGNLSLSLLQQVNEKLDFSTGEVMTQQQEILDKLKDIEEHFDSKSSSLGVCENLSASCSEIFERNPSAPSDYYWKLMDNG